MPIYAYRCTACEHTKDVLQKLSDPPLTTCPSCGADTFRKQLTAAGFQLKGSGWYVTDFKGGGAPAAKPDSDTPAAAAKADSKSGADPAPAGAPPAAPAKTEASPAVAAKPAPTTGGPTPSAQ